MSAKNSVTTTTHATPIYSQDDNYQIDADEKMEEEFKLFGFPNAGLTCYAGAAL